MDGLLPKHFELKSEGGTDLAFATVVLASYFTTFSNTRQVSAVQIVAMITLGILYVGIGIYGYAYITQSSNKLLHLIYFAIQLPLAGSIIILGKGVGFNTMILLPLAGHSVMLLSQDRMLFTNIGITLTFLLTQYFLGFQWGDILNGYQLFLACQIFIIAFTQMAVNEEKNRKEVERLANDLALANHHLREYAMQVEELAITKERNRLAREIHDGLGHYLTTIHMQIQAARAVMEKEPQLAFETLNKAQNLTQEALADVRRSVGSLRISPGEALPLEESLPPLLETCTNSGVTGQLKLSGRQRAMPPAIQLTLYRAVQEGINNTLKHAGASHIWVHLDYTQNDKIRLVVSDDGKGSDKPASQQGFGLLGLQERMNLLNGEIKFTTSPGGGFSFEIKVPA